MLTRHFVIWLSLWAAAASAAAVSASAGRISHASAHSRRTLLPAATLESSPEVAGQLSLEPAAPSPVVALDDEEMPAELEGSERTRAGPEKTDGDVEEPHAAAAAGTAGETEVQGKAEAAGAAGEVTSSKRASIGAAEADPGAGAWWRDVQQDPAQCGIEDAGRAEVLARGSRDSADACSRDCRVTAGCNAWFYCTDAGGCTDWQSVEAVAFASCLLLAADPRPQPEPLLTDVADPGGFFSYQAGYIKGEVYLRPPHITVATAIEACDPEGPTPAHKQWRHANWLNRISVANKQDYARLHGFDFVMTAITEERTKVDVILEVLEDMASKERLDWVLWAEQSAMVLNPVYTFPFSKYTDANHSIVMYGNPEDAVAGNVNGFDPGVVLMRNTVDVRAFWRAVRDTLQDTAAMAQGLKRLADLNSQNGNMNYRNAMGIMLMAEPERWLGDGKLLYFEQKYCISCYYEGADLQSPTMFVTHFTDVSHCNDFSLARDDERWPAYNDIFLHIYRLARCKLCKALKHAAERSLVGVEQPPESSTHLQALVQLPGNFNLQPDIARCRRSCRAAAGCTAWVYCWEPGGCDDSRDVRADIYPFQACQLYGAPRDRPLRLEGRGPQFSSFSSGYLARPASGPNLLCTAAGRAAGPRVLAQRAAAALLPSLVIATAIPPNPCAFPTADYINALSVANKQDYAHRHGFEVHLSAGIIDPNVTAGNWNKESMIRKMLEETPRADAEWIWWLDIDTLLPDMAVLPRFEAYEGADLVVWGNREKIMEGDMNGGINCGVLLIRNTDWARQFFADVGQYAYMQPDTIEEHMRPILEKEVHPLVSGFYDTPFITWLLKTQPKYSSMVFFEDKVGINRHFVAIDWGLEPTPLVAHFAGCTFCNPPMGKLEERTVVACNREWYKTYAHSKCTLNAHYFAGAGQCAYDKEDLNWIDIRLGE